MNEDDLLEKPNSIIIISILNFIFGLFCFFPVLLFFFVWIYGIFFSGDPLSDKILGSAGCLCFALPSLISGTLFIASGIGIWKLKTWGYYIQMATAILSILSVIGLPYGLPVMLILLKDDIKQRFNRSMYKELNSTEYNMEQRKRYYE